MRTTNCGALLRVFRGNTAAVWQGCTGCKDQYPEGVDVSEVNRCLGYTFGYNDFDLAKENDEELPSISRVNMCVDCEECHVYCVNGLVLTYAIHQARSLFA